MRALLLLVSALAFLAGPAAGQIVAVHFFSEKDAKKFKKHLVTLNGEQVVIGEPKWGFNYNREKRQLNFKPGDTNELFIADPGKPEDFAYFVVDGEKQEASKKNVLRIQGKYVEKLTLVAADQSLPGLTREYLLKREEIDGFREARDAAEKGTVPWLAQQRRVVTSLERLRGWLERTSFHEAVKDVDKELKKEGKATRDEGLRARWETARDSIEPCEVPEDFAKLSQEISGGKDVFKGYRSQHTELFYLNECDRGEQHVISDERARGLVELAERVIEEFRALHVDPYLDEDYSDHIPDELFVTWAFFPDDADDYQGYAGPLYRRQYSESVREVKGSGEIGGEPAHWRYAWRFDLSDLEGMIVHNLGHVLAAKHYGQGRIELRLDWLDEAVGNQLSYEFLGRNDVTCLGLKTQPTYERRVTPERGEKVHAVGRREVYNQLALEQGSPIQQIARKRLYELEDGDLAKGWSFYDYLWRKEGEAGQRWLRAAGKHCLEPDTFIENWRADAAKALGTELGDAFRTLEQRWRAYAESEQVAGGK